MDTKFTKWSNFVREAWLIKEKWNKRSYLKPPMNADARRCSAPLIGVDRRPSAVPYPRRYEVCSLCIGAGLDYSVSMKSSLKPDGEAIMKWNPSGPPHFRLSCFMTARMRAGLSFGPET